MRNADRSILALLGIAHLLFQSGHGYPTQGNAGGYNKRLHDPSSANTKATFMFSGPSQAIDATRSHIANQEAIKNSTRRQAKNPHDSGEEPENEIDSTNKHENDNECKDVVLKQVLDEKHRNGGIQGNAPVFTPGKKFWNVSYKYNLIWSPGSMQKLFVSSFVLFATHQYIATQMKANNLAFDWRRVLESLPTAVVKGSKIGVNFILPLMASACCAIQLLINLIAGGCAGFNTLLGPARPAFISLLLYLTVKYRSTASTMTHVIRWMVALMPEFVHLWNSYQESKIITTGAAARVSGGNVQTMPRINNYESEGNQMMAWPFRASVRVAIPAMGCVACINKIDYVLRQSVPPYRLLEASSGLNSDGQKGGGAFLQFLCVSEEEVGGIVEGLLGRIDQAGFGSELQVESVTLQKNAYENRQ